MVQMTDEEARLKFRSIRFVRNNGEPYCPYPDCGSLGVYEYKSRKVFKCKGCEKQFSLTSGTLFASRKMSYHKILLALAYFAIPAKGISAINLSHLVDCSYKAAYVLSHKFREAMAREVEAETLSGTVEIDGAEFGGGIRPPNVKKNKKDLRKYPWRSNKKQILVVARERGGRARTAVFKTEAEARPFIEAVVSSKAELHADQGSGWNALSYPFANFKRINHKEAYWTPESNTNAAENFFSVLRRSERGIYHHISSVAYLPAFGNEIAWRQNNRRVSNLEKHETILMFATRRGVSTLKGYWQRRTLKQEEAA
jgi:transposase-like protein